MTPKLKQPQQEKMKASAIKAKVKIEEAKRKLEREPSSDDQRSGLRVLAEMLALIASITTRAVTAASKNLIFAVGLKSLKLYLKLVIRIGLKFNSPLLQEINL